MRVSLKPADDVGFRDSQEIEATRKTSVVTANLKLVLESATSLSKMLIILNMIHCGYRLIHCGYRLIHCGYRLIHKNANTVISDVSVCFPFLLQ